MVNGQEKLVLRNQECNGDYDFTNPKVYMTRGFQHLFGTRTYSIIPSALQEIITTYRDTADYLQVFDYYFANGTKQKFYCIHDKSHITFLLPSEY